MHNVKQYGGKRIKAGSASIIVQFDTLENMDRWLQLMRSSYAPGQFQPYVNRAERIVTY